MSEHLYIHVPFCLKKCRYCDFYSTTRRLKFEDYTRALKREIRCRPAEQKVKTIYFGGGTPSLMPLEDLSSVLDTITATRSLFSSVEITLEANPGSVDLSYLKGLKTLGINRLSLGVQSFNPAKLATLGRIHDASQALKAVDQARAAGFDNLGLDLIFGLPGETGSLLKKDLDAALALAPEHLSCYMLTTEPGTPLHDDSLLGTFTPMPPADQVALFLQTSKILEAAGYGHYEISNFARTRDLISRHNSAYWQMRPYAGFGPSAHSMGVVPPENGRAGRVIRSWNTADLDAYLSLLLNSKALPVAETETLSPAQQMLELIMVGLRTRNGIDVAAFDILSDIPFYRRFSALTEQVIAEGFAARSNDGGRFALTRAGWARLDSIVESFAAILF